MLVPSAPRRRALPIAFIAVLAAAIALIAVSNAEAAYVVPNFTVTAAPTQAAGHPKITVSIDPDAAKADSTGGDDLKDLTIDAPAGLQLNQAAATTKCTDSTFTGSGSCPTASQVGTATVKWRRSSISTVTFSGKVYVLTTPAAANTAALGLVLKATGYKTQAIRATVSNALPVNSPTRVSLTNVARNIQSSIGLSLSATIDQIDVVLNAKANSTQSGPYFTLNPSSCTTAITQATLTSYANVVVNKSSNYVPTGCSTVKFTPTATVAPTVTNIVAPTGLNTSFTVPAGELATQQSAVKNITVATPSGVLLNQPAIAAVVPCPEANLAADTCPAASKIGTTSFTFWGAAAAPGDVYMTAKTAPGFNIGAVSRGANGVRAITRGTVAQIDNNGDGIADNLRLSLDSLPTATWSAASLNISSLLLLNNCPTGSSTTTIQSASASTVVKSGTWLVGLCDPTPDTTITSGPSGYSNLTTPQFAFTGVPASGATFECQLDGAAFTTCLSPLTTPALSQGPHTFCVRAVGAMGTDPTPACRTFTVDTVPPVVNIFSNGPSINFAVSDASPITGVTCRLNSNAAVNCTSPWTIQVFDDLSYSFTICATDAAGNIGCSTRVIDVEPPDTSITSGPSGYVGSPSANFAFTATKPTAAFACSLDNAPLAACSSPITFTGLAQGSHTFCVRATDSAGNVDPTPACRTWTVDTIAPVVIITSPPPGSSQSTVTTFTWTVSDASPIVSVTCRLDGGAATACTSPWSVSGLADGTHTVQICATDAAGNIGCATQTWIPNPGFTVSIDSGPPSTTFSTAAVFTFSSTGNGVTFQCNLDGNAYAACSSPRNLVGLTGGTHTFCVRGVDSGGFFSLNNPCQSWFVEVGPPPLPILTRVSPVASPSSQTTATFTITPGRSGDTLEGSLDGAAYSSVVSPVNLSGLTNGIHTYSVREKSPEGNIGSAVSSTWVVDTVPPPAPTVSGPSGTVGQTSATITISNTEAGTVIQGSLDGAAFATVTSPVTLTGLSYGSHAYSARSIDAAGNVSSATTIVWTIDVIDDFLTITSGPSGTVGSTSASFNFTGAGGGSTYQCQLDGAAWTACTPPMNYTGLSNGSHTFCVRAMDAAGNTGPPVCRTWTVDTVAPVAPTVTRAAPAANPSLLTTATILVTAAEPGGTLQGSFDGAAYAAITSPVSLSGLTTGVHVYSARQIDAAGNIGSSASVVWTVGGPPPPAPAITSGPSGVVASKSASFAFSISGGYPGDVAECNFDNGSWAACTSPVVYTDLSEGSHTFCARAVTVEGIRGFSGCRTWTVDTVPPPAPTVVIASPTTFPTNQTTAMIVFTSPETGVFFQGSLDGAAFANVASPASLSGLSYGTHVYSVRSMDAAGNIGSATSVTWTISNIVVDYFPFIASGPSGTVGSNSATFTFGGYPPNSIFQCTLDSSSWATCTNPVTYTLLSQGSHTVCFRPIDPVGNTFPQSCRTWTVDTIAPVVTITSSQLTFTVTDSSTITATTCKLDAGTATACTSPWQLPTVAAGAHTAQICATDTAGNIGCATYTWTAPGGGAFSVSITSGPGSVITTPTATLSYVASEPLYLPNPCAPGTPVCIQVIVPKVNLDCKLDAGSYTACPTNSQYGGSYTTPTLPVGAHTFCVRGTRLSDGAVSQACRTWTYVVEPPPAPQCNSGGNSVICTFTLASGESATCQIDSDPPVPCTSGWIRSGLAAGMHTARVCISSGSTPVCYVFTFSLAIPAVTITSPTNGSTTTASTATLNYTTTGFVGTPTCSRANGSSVLLTLGANAIVVNCDEPSSGLSATATVTVTRVALGSFAPTFDQTFSSDPSSLETGLSFTVNNPASSDPAKTVLINEPAALLPNYAAFGLPSTDRCPASTLTSTGPTTSAFTRSGCPDAAKVGQVTLSSPDYPSPLHGNVWLVNRTPLPWFAVDFLDPALGNPTNIVVPQMVLRTNLVQVDPICSPETDPAGYCPLKITLLLTGMPDVSGLQLSFTLDGPDRAGSPQPLSGKLFQFDGTCDTVSASATITPVSGGAISLSTPPVLPPCAP